MMNRKRMLSAVLLLSLLCAALCSAFALAAAEETITLRICNWEEYID